VCQKLSDLYSVCVRQQEFPNITLVSSCTLIQAFISSRLDYCNSLLYGVSDNLIRRESVQNAAARLLTGAERLDHISPVLRQLHWLPVQRRVEYKLACFVFSSLSGHAHPYLADDIHHSGLRKSHRRRLRSSTDRSCAVPRTHNTFGDRSFAVAGPRISIVPLNSEPGLNPKPVIGRRLCNLGHNLICL